MATKKFIVPFASGFLNMPTIDYVVKVTDREEERDFFKRVAAIDKAVVMFEREYGGNGNRYVLLNKVKDVTGQKLGN